MSQNLLFAAVVIVIGALRVKFYDDKEFFFPKKKINWTFLLCLLEISLPEMI